MNSSPEQSKSQSRNALVRANEVRLGRAKIRKTLHEASDRREALSLLASMIECNEPLIQTATLYSLVKSCRRVGVAISRTILRNMGVSHSCRVDALSDRRRAFVVSCLRRNGPVE